MEADTIQEYWNGRAKEKPQQATTDDFYLRDIEFNVVRGVVASGMFDTVLDVGCGDAKTTFRLASGNPHIKFEGIDFAPAMIDAAKDYKLPNLSVSVGDISAPLKQTNVGIVYTTRCLINLPTWEAQKSAIGHIYDALRAGGYFLMIENFIEGHEAFNKLRVKFDLPEIPVRPHNLFFRHDELTSFMSGKFSLLLDENISSAYYLATRIVYARICADNGAKPDYMDPHHQYAARLPFSGDHGPVRALLFQKRMIG